MKVALICRGRTRSNAVMADLASRYNLQNKSEIYFQNHEFFYSYKVKMKSSQLKTFDDKFLYFQNLMKKTTSELFNQNNFICKIWPSMLIFKPAAFSAEDSFQDIHKKTIFNISEAMSIHQYDKIIWLDRDLLSSTLSWVYAKHTNIFSVTQNKTVSFEPIKLTDHDISVAKFYVLEYCLHKKMRDYFVGKNIPIEEYADFENLRTNKSVKLIDPKNNYYSLINDVDTLVKEIHQFYDICLKETENWQFI